MHSLGVKPFQDAVPELFQTGGPEQFQRGSPELFQTGCPEQFRRGGAVTGATPPFSWVYRHRTPVLIHITRVGAALPKGGVAPVIVILAGRLEVWRRKGR